MNKLFQEVNRIAIDTNIFIYLLEGHSTFASKTKYIFDFLHSHKGVTSILTLTELLAFKANGKEIKEIEELFFSTPNLTVLDVTKEIAKEAARIRRKNSFRLADSVQLATALIFKADIFITNDARLKNFKEIKTGLLSEIA